MSSALLELALLTLFFFVVDNPLVASLLSKYLFVFAHEANMSNEDHLYKLTALLDVIEAETQQLMMIWQADIASLADVRKAMKIEHARGGNCGAMDILTRLAEADWLMSWVSAFAMYALLTFEEDHKLSDVIIAQ